jgi:quinone-modifying oxidoreductase subunit QmoB
LDIKLGLYLCEGCQITDNIDVQGLADLAENEFNIAVCRRHPVLCSGKGIELINEDIQKENLGGVVIAACSPRYNTDVFSFPRDVINERVNLREQVAWIGNGACEDLQMLAEDYVRMGIVRALNICMQKPYLSGSRNRSILVIGGGITGITAAVEGAKAGYSMILVEKEKSLGGWSAILHRQLPVKAPYMHSSVPLVDGKIKEVNELDNINVITSASIKEIYGEPGRFEVVVSVPDKEYKLTVASIVAALGWHPYDARKLTEYGYSMYKDVITSVELEKMAKAKSIARPSDKKMPESVLFIQCAGSRTERHLPYCSSYCCGTTLKQATYIREASKDSSVYIIYKDIRTPGHYEDFYKEVQKDERIFMTKGEVVRVGRKNGKLVVRVCDTLLGEDINVAVDLVVLAMGMIPAQSSELNLKYRLGKGLPQIKYDFPDSHFICFPYETRRTGIYAAGTFRAPMDIVGCMEDAMGATLKAIQCLEAVARGESVHPRSGDRSFPELYMDRCTDCKRCTEECPFGAYDENEHGTPLLNISRCRRCALCLGSCPERVISFGDYSVNIVSSMIKSVHVPLEDEEKPRILAFVCENDAYPAFDMAGYRRLRYSAFIRIIPVRCLGSINTVWIYDALASGFDGILQIGCKPGDNYQCHYMHGSELNDTRSANMQKTLSGMMIEPERIKTEFLEISDYYKIPALINSYVNAIKKMGPSPFKGL